MSPRLLVLAAAVAVPLACRTGRAPYQAPSPAGAAALSREDAAKLLVLVVAESDPQVTPPWVEKAGKAADAVAAALAEGGFRTTRGGGRWGVRVTVSALLRGGDFGIVADAGGKVLEELKVAGGGWGPGELAELGRAVRERLERSAAVARLAGVTPAVAAVAAAPAPPAADGPAQAGPRKARRLAVLDFRGAAAPKVLALLADQARAAAAEGAGAGRAVLTREAVTAALREKGRGVEPCADAECELEVARAAGADLVVTGEVTEVGDARVLVLRLVDVAAGTLAASRTAQARDELGLVEATRAEAAALFR